MDLRQAAFLLQLAQNTHEEGNELIVEMNRQGLAHARRLMEEFELLEKAMEINRQDRQRFAQYLPAQQHSQQLGNQRASLAPVKKASSDAPQS